MNDENRFLDQLKDIFSINKMAKFLFENKFGIIIVLEFIKAPDWPRKNKILIKEPLKVIPLLWGIIYALNKDEIEMIYDIFTDRNG